MAGIPNPQYMDQDFWPLGWGCWGFAEGLVKLLCLKTLHIKTHHIFLLGKAHLYTIPHEQM